MSHWHHRLSHASEPLIRQMAADGTIPSHLINLSHKLPFCTSCAEMNMTKKGPVPNGASRDDQVSPVVSRIILEEISVDVAGPSLLETVPATVGLFSLLNVSPALNKLGL